MAPPQGEAILTSLSMPNKTLTRPSRLSNSNFKRVVSENDLFKLNNEIDREIEETTELPSISEVENAKCECCGMCEEYTPEYIKRVRDKFLGKWICGLCGDAVKEEMEKNEGNCIKEALEVHMSHCVRFNKFGRYYPVLCQAQAMRELLKRSSRVRGKSMSPRDHLRGLKKDGMTRSSSCMSLTNNNPNNED
ncbi:uncharacterized protein LOC130805958 [Amaranthus tricolor]|uniref:uncharacterized protein LOC130805958 n=1 Tax=Amaranthus tricolor TaxID=29722 RepID=UPI0025870D3F|nr:uncharacterized protein LOC130805958 [Amaranthus tricolor]